MTRAFGAILIIGILLMGCASNQERKALQARKDNVVIVNTQLAGAYLQRGQLDVALYNISKALALAPNDSQANNVMALLQWRLKEHDAADKRFRQALRSQPDNAEARNNYGAFLCERGNVDKAVKQFELALADPLYTTPAQANLNAGLCLMKKPAPVAAESYFREVLKLDPKRKEALYQMAKISYDSGETYSARGFIQRFFEVAADTPGSLLLAVKIEGKLRAKDSEASYALRLRGKFPDSPETQQLRKLSATD